MSLSSRIRGNAHTGMPADGESHAREEGASGNVPGVRPAGCRKALDAGENIMSKLCSDSLCNEKGPWRYAIFMCMQVKRGSLLTIEETWARIFSKQFIYRYRLAKLQTGILNIISMGSRKMLHYLTVVYRSPRLPLAPPLCIPCTLQCRRLLGKRDAFHRGPPWRSQPYSNGQLPNLTIRKEMLAIMLMLPVQVDHLKRSGIGKVVMGLLHCKEVRYGCMPRQVRSPACCKSSNRARRYFLNQVGSSRSSMWCFFSGDAAQRLARVK